MDFYRDRLDGFIQPAHDRHMTESNPIIAASQSLADFANPRLHSAGSLNTTEGENQRLHCTSALKYRTGAIVRIPDAFKHRYFHVWPRGSSSAFIETELQFDKVRDRAGAHLFHNLGPVNFDGALAEIQVDRNDLIGRAIDHQCHDLALARGQ